MVAQSIVPAVVGAAVDALISRQTHMFALDVPPSSALA
jgi:hypothetical protein